MSNIWFAGDYHYGHANIVKGISEWESKKACRDFNTLEEHNAKLIDNINACAKEKDIVYFLGDFALGGRQSIYEFYKRLACKNIHLILGNHDHHIRKNATIITDDGKEIGAQSLFLSVNDILCKKIANEKIVLCHYAMRTWDSGYHGAIMLHAHSHGTLQDYSINLQKEIRTKDGSLIKTITEPVKFKTMDVGVDTHPEFRPYHIEEINKEMSNRIPLRVDNSHDLII